MINSQWHDRITSLLIVLLLAGAVALVTDRVTATVVTENAWVIDKQMTIQSGPDDPNDMPERYEAVIRTGDHTSKVSTDKHIYERLPHDHQVTVQTTTGGFSGHIYSKWFVRLYPTVYHHSVVPNDLDPETLMNRQELHDLLANNGFDQLESNVNDAFYKKIHSNRKFKYYIQIKFNSFDKAISINGVAPLRWLDKQGLLPEDEV